MALFKKLACGVSVAALAALAPAAAVYAQETSSQLRGAVVDASGAPISGARLIILHTPSGTVSEAVTGATGAFFQSGLRVGGPYTITVVAPGFEGDVIENLSLRPGSQPPLRIALRPAATTDVIVVTGQAVNTLDLNNGVGSSYTAEDIANQPSLARDVISTLARDPLAITGGPNNLSVAGANPRFNGVTIDGARQQDAFGLGTNTFATARSPINIDIIESVSLVAADYTVIPSGFTGGLVNVTTRGGTNEFDGSAFYFYRDQDYFGSSTFGGQGSFDPGQFEEKEYGVTVRGPIIEDTLFFSISYDKFETATAIDFNASDASNGVDPAFFDALTNLVQTTYGVDLQGRPQQAAVPSETERLFARFDWNINEDHRFRLSYQHVEDAGISNIGSRNFVSAWYDTPTELTSWSGELFSDWTDNLSTTLRASHIDYTRGQICRAGEGVGTFEFRLNEADVTGTALDGLLTGPSIRTFTGGCDRFRHANDYADERLTLFGQADYVWNDFVFTVGGEYESLDVFNVFVERSRGLFRFESVDEIVNQIADIQYRNVPSNNALDGAAAWGYERWTGFAQTRWQALDNLEITGGLRYETISTGDTPTLDPSFVGDVGFANTTTTDGLDLLMPRVGFSYEPLERTTITGGFGVFSGGDPAVWTSNAYQVPAVFASANNFAGVTGTSIPQSLLTTVANGNPLAIDAIDPNFELPSDLKASLRIDQEFDINIAGFNLGSGYVASAQALYSESINSFLWREAAQTNQQPQAGNLGVAPDGRTIYADLQALGISNRTILTNGSGDQSLVLTVSLANDFDNGFGFYAAYAHQDVEMLTEGSSSRGISSWRGQADADRNFPSPRTSIYEIEHVFKLAFSYERAFIRDLNTRFDLFGDINSGAPFTYTFDVDSGNALFGRAGNGESPFDNNPLYIPSMNDSRVVYASGFNQAAFNAFIEGAGVPRGQIHEVNSDNGPWNQRWDFRFQQDLPGIFGADRFVGDNRFKFVLDIENVLNLLNEDWGTRVNAPGNGQLQIVRADLVRAADVAGLGVDAAPALTGDAPRTSCLAASDCVYRFNSFSDRGTGFRSNSGSVWRARVGIRYEF